MTRSPRELPLDERGQIPGQMSIDEVIEEMPEGPRRASAIEAETQLTPEQLKQQKMRREVQGRIAKRQALKKAGADVRSTNPDLAASLEDSLRRADRRVADKGRLQRLVQDRMAKDRKR
jgi:hypothetical protein